MSKNKRKAPKLKFTTALFKGSFIHNPVLTQIIGICPIIAAATTVKNALAISLVTALLLILCEAITSLLLKKISRWVRISVYTVASVLFVAALEALAHSFTSGLGIYLYLLCVNGLIVIRCEKFASKTTLRNSVIDAVACSVGFSVVAVIVGAVREFITYGTLFPAEGTLPKTSAAALPFVGLMLLGILAAVHKAFVIRFYPSEEVDTFSLSSVTEKTVFKDPGLGKKPHKKPKKDIEEENFDIIRPRYSIEDIETERTDSND